MAEPIYQRPASSAHTRIVRAPDGRSADIIELIIADHRRIRRLRQALDDAIRSDHSGPGWLLAHVWQRLADVLVTHTQAEQEICYLSMFAAGQREEWRDAVADNDDIHEAVSEASLKRPGSAGWWRAVGAALAAGARHIERAEGGALARWQLRLTASQRFELGRQWSAFVAAWTQDAGHQAAEKLAANGAPVPGPQWHSSAQT